MIQTIDKKIVIVLVFLIALFAVGIIYLMYAASSKIGSVSVQTEQSTTQLQTVHPTIPQDMIPTSDTTIVLTNTGFEPKAITIKTAEGDFDKSGVVREALKLYLADILEKI